MNKSVKLVSIKNQIRLDLCVFNFYHMFGSVFNILFASKIYVADKVKIFSRDIWLVR